MKFIPYLSHPHTQSPGNWQKAREGLAPPKRLLQCSTLRTGYCFFFFFSEMTLSSLCPLHCPVIPASKRLLKFPWRSSGGLWTDMLFTLFRLAGMWYSYCPWEQAIKTLCNLKLKGNGSLCTTLEHGVIFNHIVSVSECWKDYILK